MWILLCFLGSQRTSASPACLENEGRVEAEPHSGRTSWCHSSLTALVFQSIALVRLVLLALRGCLRMGSVVGLTVCSKSTVCPGWPALLSVSPGAGEPFEGWLAFPLAFALVSRGLQFLVSLHVPLSDHTTLLQDGSLGLHEGIPHVGPPHSRVNVKSL